MRVTQMSAFSESKYKYPSKKTQSSFDAVIPPTINKTLSSFNKILSKFETDDYILAGILIVLILEGCDDYVLLAALGYLFVMGFKENQQ